MGKVRPGANPQASQTTNRHEASTRDAAVSETSQGGRGSNTRTSPELPPASNPLTSPVVDPSQLPSVGRAQPAQSIGHEIEAAKKAPVPQRVQHVDPKTGQREGNCGFYALGMVMDHWHGKDSRNATAWVQDKDIEGPGHHFNHPATTSERILDYGHQAGFTTTGEMFVGSQLAEVAEHFGYETRTHQGAGLDELVRVLDRGRPALIAIDADEDGNPTEGNGHLAHWVVVQGYFDDEDGRKFVARHGWGVQKDHVWDADQLAASWANLNETTYFGRPGDGQIPGHPDLSEPRRLAVGVSKNGLADTSKTLASVLVEVIGHEP